MRDARVVSIVIHAVTLDLRSDQAALEAGSEAHLPQSDARRL